MNVSIYSRKAAEELISSGNFPKKVLVISFHNPPNKYDDGEPLDYSSVCRNVVYVAEFDFDLSYIQHQGRTYEDFFKNVDEVAEIVYEAHERNFDIICQCEYGESRSAACAAAIREHFFRDGITIFSDYRYCPNHLIYHKVLEALENYKKYNKSLYYYRAKEDFIKSRLGMHCNYDEIFGNLSFDSKRNCIDSKEEIEKFLRDQNLLCSSVTDAVNAFINRRPIPFVSLHLTDCAEKYDSKYGLLPIALVNEHKYICEKVKTVIWLYDGNITAERMYNGQLQKREIYFGRQFDSFKVNECNVLGTVFWDEFNKELTVSPMIITDIDFNQYSSFSGKIRTKNKRHLLRNYMH